MTGLFASLSKYPPWPVCSQRKGYWQVLEPYYLALDDLWNRLQTVNELITDTEVPPQTSSQAKRWTSDKQCAGCSAL